MKKIVTLFLSFLTFQVFFSSIVYADPSASISLNPENPAPKSNVTLTLESYSFNVNTAMITWKINNVVIRRGEGEKTFILKTGNVGDTSQVTVTAETADGSSIEQSVDIVPSSVVLLYEAPRSYVPLLYEGRSLPSDGGLVHVTALPQISDNGTPVSPSSLTYSWYLNNLIMRSVSGVGKQSANIRLDYLKDKNDIKVIVTSPFGNSGTKKISIYPHTIMPLLYINDSVLGPNFTSLIEKRFETVNDFTLSLEPFYVSQKEQKDPTFMWYLDGLPATPLGGRLLSLHPKENSYGTKMLTIKVEGLSRSIQSANTQLEIIYDTRK